MAALLVGLSVMAIMMTVVMPVWKQATQREKESELVFRGQQYARAISLFQRKQGPGTLPPSLDVLLEGRFLRKKFKDPITNEDFELIKQTVGTAPGTGTPSTATPGRGASPTTSPTAPGGRSGGITGAAVVSGGITGVQSKSKEKSIRVYNGRTHYNEWAFIFQPPAQAPGTPGAVGPGGRPGGPGVPGLPGTGRGTGPGGRGIGPGGRGGPIQPIGPGRGFNPFDPIGRGRSGR